MSITRRSPPDSSELGASQIGVFSMLGISVGPTARAATTPAASPDCLELSPSTAAPGTDCDISSSFAWSLDESRAAGSHSATLSRSQVIAGQGASRPASAAASSAASENMSFGAVFEDASFHAAGTAQDEELSRQELTTPPSRAGPPLSQAGQAPLPSRLVDATPNTKQAVSQFAAELYGLFTPAGVKPASSSDSRLLAQSSTSAGSAFPVQAAYSTHGMVQLPAARLSDVSSASSIAGSEPAEPRLPARSAGLPQLPTHHTASTEQAPFDSLHALSSASAESAGALAPEELGGPAPPGDHETSYHDSHSESGSSSTASVSTACSSADDDSESQISAILEASPCTSPPIMREPARPSNRLQVPSPTRLFESPGLTSMAGSQGSGARASGRSPFGTHASAGGHAESQHSDQHRGTAGTPNTTASLQHDGMRSASYAGAESSLRVSAEHAEAASKASSSAHDELHEPGSRVSTGYAKEPKPTHVLSHENSVAIQQPGTASLDTTLGSRPFVGALNFSPHSSTSSAHQLDSTLMLSSLRSTPVHTTARRSKPSAAAAPAAAPAPVVAPAPHWAARHASAERRSPAAAPAPSAAPSLSPPRLAHSEVTRAAEAGHARVPRAGSARILERASHTESVRSVTTQQRSVSAQSSVSRCSSVSRKSQHSPQRLGKSPAGPSPQPTTPSKRPVLVQMTSAPAAAPKPPRAEATHGPASKPPATQARVSPVQPKQPVARPPATPEQPAAPSIPPTAAAPTAAAPAPSQLAHRTPWSGAGSTPDASFQAQVPRSMQDVRMVAQDPSTHTQQVAMRMRGSHVGAVQLYIAPPDGSSLHKITSRMPVSQRYRLMQGTHAMTAEAELSVSPSTVHSQDIGSEWRELHCTVSMKAVPASMKAKHTVFALWVCPSPALSASDVHLEPFCLPLVVESTGGASVRGSGSSTLTRARTTPQRATPARRGRTSKRATPPRSTHSTPDRPAVQQQQQQQQRTPQRTPQRMSASKSSAQASVASTTPGSRRGHLRKSAQRRGKHPGARKIKRKGAQSRAAQHMQSTELLSSAGSPASAVPQPSAVVLGRGDTISNAAKFLLDQSTQDALDLLQTPPSGARQSPAAPAQPNEAPASACTVSVEWGIQQAVPDVAAQSSQLPAIQVHALLLLSNLTAAQSTALVSCTKHEAMLTVAWPGVSVTVQAVAQAHMAGLSTLRMSWTFHVVLAEHMVAGHDWWISQGLTLQLKLQRCAGMSQQLYQRVLEQGEGAWQCAPPALPLLVPRKPAVHADRSDENAVMLHSEASFPCVYISPDEEAHLLPAYSTLEVGSTAQHQLQVVALSTWLLQQSEDHSTVQVLQLFGLLRRCRGKLAESTATHVQRILSALSSNAIDAQTAALQAVQALHQQCTAVLPAPEPVQVLPAQPRHATPPRHHAAAQLTPQQIHSVRAKRLALLSPQLPQPQRAMAQLGAHAAPHSAAPDLADVSTLSAGSAAECSEFGDLSSSMCTDVPWATHTRLLQPAAPHSAVFSPSAAARALAQQIKQAAPGSRYALERLHAQELNRSMREASSAAAHRASPPREALPAQPSIDLHAVQIPDVCAVGSSGSGKLAVRNAALGTVAVRLAEPHALLRTSPEPAFVFPGGQVQLAIRVGVPMDADDTFAPVPATWDAARAELEMDVALHIAARVPEAGAAPRLHRVQLRVPASVADATGLWPHVQVQAEEPSSISIHHAPKQLAAPESSLSPAMSTPNRSSTLHVSARSAPRDATARNAAQQPVAAAPQRQLVAALQTAGARLSPVPTVPPAARELQVHASAGTALLPTMDDVAAVRARSSTPSKLRARVGRKARGVQVKGSTVSFPETPAGDITRVKVQICNTARVSMHARVTVHPAAGRTMLEPAFGIREVHHVVQMRPRSYVMLPVYFVPPAGAPSGQRYSAELRVQGAPEDGNAVPGMRLVCAVELHAQVE